jgi:hypothetical protein
MKCREIEYGCLVSLERGLEHAWPDCVSAYCGEILVVINYVAFDER